MERFYPDVCDEDEFGGMKKKAYIGESSRANAIWPHANATLLRRRPQMNDASEGIRVMVDSSSVNHNLYYYARRQISLKLNDQACTWR